MEFGWDEVGIAFRFTLRAHPQHPVVARTIPPEDRQVSLQGGRGQHLLYGEASPVPGVAGRCRGGSRMASELFGEGSG